MPDYQSGTAALPAAVPNLCCIVARRIKCIRWWAHWSRSFCCGPQGEALWLLGTLFW